ncbi:UTP-glucose-1-phosphate uridylyltransferase, partial [Mucor velutinosus]
VATSVVSIYGGCFFSLCLVSGVARSLGFYGIADGLAGGVADGIADGIAAGIAAAASLVFSGLPSMMYARSLVYL